MVLFTSSPIENWYVNNYRDWLSVRDLNTTGKVDELKKRIYQIKRDKTNPPIPKKLMDVRLNN